MVAQLSWYLGWPGEMTWWGEKAMENSMGWPSQALTFSGGSSWIGRKSRNSWNGEFFKDLKFRHFLLLLYSFRFCVIGCQALLRVKFLALPEPSHFAGLWPDPKWPSAVGHRSIEKGMTWWDLHFLRQADVQLRQVRVDRTENLEVGNSGKLGDHFLHRVS